MRTIRKAGLGLLVMGFVVVGCSTQEPGPTSQASPSVPQSVEALTPAPTEAPINTSTPSMPATPSRRTLLVDTDVAGDDLIALAFLVSARHVTIAGITVSGTGEAHCSGGVDIVLRLLDRLRAADIPVACGRETPLAGDHAFPETWRDRADAGSGLTLPPTTRRPSTLSAVELISDLAKQHVRLHVLTLGPVTNLAEALQADPGLAARLGPVTIMGGALHVPGNLVCCGAPAGNDVAEWNVYVDPQAAQVLIDSGLEPAFVSLDGTNQVPVTDWFAGRAMDRPPSPARTVLADLFTANPFMADGSYYLWDALAAELAAGYEVGAFTPARVVVETTEGPESGFTRPIDGKPNIRYLATADAAAAESTLLAVLAASPAVDARLGWPSTGPNPPGSYAWGNGCGQRSCVYGFMHNCHGPCDVAITITAVAQQPVVTGTIPVTVAGRSGTYRRVVEPEPSPVFSPNGPLHEEWLVEIDGDLVAIRLYAQPDASEAGLADAHAIVDSLRYEAGGIRSGFHLVFTLTTSDWDSA